MKVRTEMILLNGFVGEGNNAPGFKAKPRIVESEQEDAAKKTAAIIADAKREDSAQVALPIETPEL